ncbi:MAG: metal-dependent hydrolase [Proteobacteria bacterium]|nr:metal-dependent hydrolase [Pseudomonadota bacterium]
MFPTLMMNGFTIYVPIIEHYMLRQVRPLISEIRDPELKQRVNNFVIQEFMHAREHDRSREYLRNAGFKTEWLYRCTTYFVDTIVGNLANFCSVLFGKYFPLACVAGAEHWTTMTADINFSYPHFSKVKDSPMLWLFAWHGAEEIEHKSVTFDLLQHLKPGYALRVWAFLFVTVIFFFLNLFVISTLLFQLRWKEMLHPELWVGAVFHLFIGAKVVPKSLLAFFDYLRPSFHPNDRDNAHLMELGFKIAKRGEVYGMTMRPIKKKSFKDYGVIEIV